LDKEDLMQLRVFLKIGVFLAVLVPYISFSNACLAAGKWNQKTNGISAVGDHTAVVYNGKMYVFGGTDGTNYYDDLWEYEFATDNWSWKAEGATPRDTHSAVVYNGKMYIFGGWDENLGRSNDVWEYDFLTNSFSQKASGASARNQHSAVQYDGKMYIFGGSGVTGYVLDTLWEYDIAADTWTKKSAAPVSRKTHSAIVHNGKMYVSAGFDNSDVSNTLLEYDFTSDTWTQKSAIPFVSVDQQAVYSNGSIYVFGGLTEDGGGSLTFLNDVWKYDISTELWTQINTCGMRPKSRLINSAVIYEEKMYIFGGAGDLVGDVFNEYYDDIWEYDFTYSCLPWLMLLVGD
jgi:N-acetylneuraminic acid mutarotase